jgi:hypothetical protein
VPYAVYVYNTTIHTATEFAAWVQVRSAIRTKRECQRTVQLRGIKGRLQTAHEVARQKLILRKEQYDKGTEPFQLDVGQQVLLYDETARRGRSVLSTLGPMKCIRRRGKSCDQEGAQVHVNRLKAFAKQMVGRA